ncbi:hypothetical protein WSM22_03470 [Cytophagales bacterium WSM2-2]|nr:hypothetical protein WSM22_03470 [Cytophagales bacterium WSM2-2]
MTDSYWRDSFEDLHFLNILLVLCVPFFAALLSYNICGLHGSAQTGIGFGIFLTLAPYVLYKAKAEKDRRERKEAFRKWEEEEERKSRNS